MYRFFLLFMMSLSLFGSNFTDDETKWIATHTVKVGVESWEPVVNINNENEIDGIAGDILKLIINKTGLKVEYISNSWDILLQDFKDKKIDLLPATYFTKERSEYGLYTNSYFSMKEYIYIRQNETDINSFDDLKNRKIAIIKDYGTIPKIKKKYPTIKIIETKNMQESINFLLEGKVDAYIDAQIGVVNYINKNVIVGIKGISQDQFEASPLHFFSNIDKPILHTILEKSLNLISSEEKNKIISKWLQTTNIQGDNLKHLTLDEIEYLKQNKTIKMCNNPNWTPIEFKENDLMQGIAIDYLKQIEDKLNIKFEHIPTSSWSQSQEFLKEKKCDILPAATPTKSRKKYAVFTKTYMSYPLAVITQSDKPFVSNIDSIIDKSISRKKGSGLIAKLKNKYPNVNIVETSGYEESLKKVASGEVYSTIATLPVASYYISKFGLYNLHIAGYLDMKFDLSIAIRDDKKILKDILNKTIDTFSKNDINRIQNNWSTININETKSINYKLLFQIVLFLGIVSILIIYRQYKLKQHQKELKEQNTKFQLMLNATMEAVVLSKDNKIVEINDAALKLIGEKSKDEIIGVSIFDFVPDESKGIIEEKTKLKFASAYEVTLQTLDRVKFPALVQAASFDTDKENVRIITILNLKDIKEKEKLLSQSAKMAQMGEMIGNIAHQWRQPLSVITTAATGIKVNKEYDILTDEDLIEFSDSIISNANHLSNTIDTFRNFIKEKVELKKVILQDRIDNALGIINTRLANKYIKLYNEIDYNNPIEAVIVLGELSQVIINIFNNAIDALDEKKQNDKWIKISLREDEKFAYIDIEDNAGGIPEEIKDKIFEPYFTTKHQSVGTGIGLYMSYDIVVNHLKGNLSVENTNFGAKFTIQISRN